MSTFQLAFERCEILLLESSFGQHMLAAYRRLPDRDQRWVWVLSIAAGAALLLLLLLVPAGRYALGAMQAYQRANADYHWLLAHQEQAGQIAAVRRAAAERPDLQPTLLTSAKGSGVRIGRFESLADGGLRVWLEGANFVAAMTWIDNLRARYQLHVSRFEVDAKGSAGNGMVIRVDVAP